MFVNCFTALCWKALEKFKCFHNSVFQTPSSSFLIHSWQFSLPNKRQIWHRRNKQAQQRRKLFSVPTSWRIATTFSTALRSEVGWAREVFPLITVYINVWKPPTSFLWVFFFFSFKFWEGSWEMKGGSTRIFEKPQQCFSTPFNFTSMGWFQTHLEMKASDPLPGNTLEVYISPESSVRLVICQASH